MGELKNKLMELEEGGVIAWSSVYKHYYLVGKDHSKEFNLTEYGNGKTQKSRG